MRHFVSNLDLGSEQLHDEAERLEHALSDDLEKSLAEYLGNPTRDPHGHPIPGPNGELPSDNDLTLTKAPFELFKIPKFRIGILKC